MRASSHPIPAKRGSIKEHADPRHSSTFVWMMLEVASCKFECHSSTITITTTYDINQNHKY